MESTLINIDKTIGDRIEDFLSGIKGGVATLKEIYGAIKDKPEETLRCAIYRDKKNRFKKVAKGVYMVVGENTSGLIIHGNGRNLEEIEDGSIDFIVTDHPWRDEKAHKSGNQKNFAADYENATFRYTQEDFDNKARALKDGAFCAEFIPSESFSNFDYLYEIKKMAEKAGLYYYAKLMWVKAPEGTVNTGRTTKGTEDIIIFTKGKPRRLSPTGKPYFTKNILNGRVEIPAPKPKDKRHQAEKPVNIYRYLIEYMTNEHDVVLDQFGGSCNVMEASLSTNRFCVVYEYLKKYIDNAVSRFNAVPLFVNNNTDCEGTEDFATEEINTIGDVPVVNMAVIECVEDVSKTDELPSETNASIPKETTIHQLNLLRKVAKKYENLFNTNDLVLVNILGDSFNNEASTEVNRMFSDVFNKAYESVYKRANFSIDRNNLLYKDMVNVIDVNFCERIENPYLRPYYKNYKVEAEDFASYLIANNKISCLEDVKVNLKDLLDEYAAFASNNVHFKGKNVSSVLTMIAKIIA